MRDYENTTESGAIRCRPPAMILTYYVAVEGKIGDALDFGSPLVGVLREIESEAIDDAKSIRGRSGGSARVLKITELAVYR